MQILAAIANHQKTVMLGFAFTVLCYYFIMDSILYTSLQSVNLVDEKKVEGSSWSPFHPLSMKLLMTDQTTHYVITPSSEYINEITKFSEVFYFITPNMITFTHLIVGFIAGFKFVYSDSLQARRIGVLLFEFRSFLDALDGTVYRSRASNKLYTSDHSNFGFWVDSTCDTAGGFFLCFGVLFALWWKIRPQKEVATLPWTSEDNGKHANGMATEKHATRTNGGYSNLFIFWRTFCFGGTLGISSAMWDQTLEHYNEVFMVKLEDPELKTLQAESLHATTTWVIIWLWRILEGQSLLQMICIAIFLDKIWEFLKMFQYVGFVIVCLLVIVSHYHISHVRQILQL